MLFFQSIQAQDYIIQTQYFGIEDGLSHRDVQCIHQDQQGGMWFGTRYGLNSFDGYEFKWYNKGTHHFQSDFVNHIIEDPEKYFWLFDTDTHHLKSVRSIDIFDPITEQSLSFEDFFVNPPFEAKDVISFNQNEYDACNGWFPIIGKN